MRVLLACEESQEVCREFRRRGHAFTWDDGTPPDYCPYCGARIIREETDDAD